MITGQIHDLLVRFLSTMATNVMKELMPGGKFYIIKGCAPSVGWRNTRGRMGHFPSKDWQGTARDHWQGHSGLTTVRASAAGDRGL